MSRITDDIFNTYVRRIGTIDPPITPSTATAKPYPAPA